jgi:penicillin-binding protein 1A
VWLGYDMPRTIIANGYAGELAVPLWGRFMANATRGSKPDRFAMPSTVVPVTICRLSGKLPTDGCRSAVVFNDDGEATDRSMVYTEYFVRGTEPNDYCPLHLRDFDTVATSGDPRAGSAVTATTGAGTADTTKAGEAGGENPSPERKRGFWGRIFGR